MKHEETIFTLFILGVVAAMLVLSFGYRSGARLVPVLVGSITLALMIYISLMALFPGFARRHRHLENPTAEDGKEKIRTTGERVSQAAPGAVKQRERAVIGWLLFLTGAIYLLGFLLAIPIFLFLFLKLWAHESWKVSLWLPGLVAGITYLLFMYILRVPLHRGVIFG